LFLHSVEKEKSVVVLCWQVITAFLQAVPAFLLAKTGCFFVKKE